MQRFSPITILGLSLTVALMLACNGDTDAELEIVDVRRAGSGTLSAGDPISLQVEVRNNASGSPTVAAAVVGDLDSGLILRGPAQPVSGSETVTLELEIPAERPYLRACELHTTVFLATTGDPPNLFAHTWTDAVADNHARVFSVPVDRPVPESFAVVEPIQEVVVSVTDRTLRRRYEAEASVLPTGSRWAVDGLTLQTQDATGTPVEVLSTDLVGGQMRSQHVIWTGGQVRRDSVSRGTVQLRFSDCTGEEREILEERLRIQLAPR